jgi:uncharacterized membrane protein
MYFMLNIFILLCVHTSIYKYTPAHTQIYAHKDVCIIGLFFGVGCLYGPFCHLILCWFFVLSEILADKLLYLLVSVLAHSSR